MSGSVETASIFEGEASVLGKKSPKREICLKQKITCKKAFQDHLKSCVSFRGDLEGSNEEKLGRQQKEEVL